MGTCCTIGMLNDDGSVSSIYCQWDGYLSGVGEKLKLYYSHKDEVENLISLGDISSLEKRIYPDKFKSHTFEDPQPDVTVAYHRDRGEDWAVCKPAIDHSAQYYGSHCKCDYCYLYDIHDQQWKVFKRSTFVPY